VTKNLAPLNRWESWWGDDEELTKIDDTENAYFFTTFLRFCLIEQTNKVHNHKFFGFFGGIKYWFYGKILSETSQQHFNQLIHDADQEGVILSEYFSEEVVMPTVSVIANDIPSQTIVPQQASMGSEFYKQLIDECDQMEFDLTLNESKKYRHITRSGIVIDRKRTDADQHAWTKTMKDLKEIKKSHIEAYHIAHQQEQDNNIVSVLTKEQEVSSPPEKYKTHPFNRKKRDSIAVTLSQMARTKFPIETRSMANKLVVRHYIHSEMEKIGMRPFHIAQTIGLAVEMVFVPNEYDIEVTQFQSSIAYMNQFDRFERPYTTSWFSTLFKWMPSRVPRRGYSAG
jgi:hypothetical protein